MKKRKTKVIPTRSTRLPKFCDDSRCRLCSSVRNTWKCWDMVQPSRGRRSAPRHRLDLPHPHTQTNIRTDRHRQIHNDHVNVTRRQTHSDAAGHIQTPELPHYTIRNIRPIIRSHYCTPPMLLLTILFPPFPPPPYG